MAGFVRREWTFWLVIGVGVLLAFALKPHPVVAAFFGFAFAAQSAIGNDSMQTLGTFIASNRRVPWWALSGFISVVMVGVMLFGWLSDGGSISFGRLDRFDEFTSFTTLQMLAPLVLLILTRYGIPVSTSFLLLGVFATPSLIQGMVVKTMAGYAGAFVAAIGVWLAVRAVVRRVTDPDGGRHPAWRVAQWCSTGLLWAYWLKQDTANIAIFLPKQLGATELVLALAIMVGVVFGVMVRRGGRIQRIVEQKSATDDVRSATLVDLAYAVLLLIFKEVNSLPMSTTWVFLGLLAGRQTAYLFTRYPGATARDTLSGAGRDLGKAAVGLIISLGMYGLGVALARDVGDADDGAEAQETVVDQAPAETDDRQPDETIGVPIEDQVLEDQPMETQGNDSDEPAPGGD
ncbi:MAG: hypothetical protein AAF108_06890 [Planctomycetota bacterium]